MDPITKLIDKAEDLLGHSPHPAIIALPLGAWGVSNICDALALASGEDHFDDAASISMGIGLAGAAAAIVTGMRDYSHIPVDRPSHEIATTHALGNAVVATLFTSSYILRTRAAAKGEQPSVLTRLLALAGGGLSLYTGYLGGKLVEEHGEAVKPVMERQLHEEQHERGRQRLAPESPLGVAHA